MIKNIVISDNGKYKAAFYLNKFIITLYKSRKIKFEHKSKYKLKSVFFSPHNEYLVVSNNHFVYLVNIYTGQVDFRYNTIMKNLGAYYLSNKNIIIVFEKHVEILHDQITPTKFSIDYIQPVENFNFFFIINSKGLHFVNNEFQIVKKLDYIRLPFKSIAYYNKKTYFLYKDRIEGPNFTYSIKNVKQIAVYENLLIILKNSLILILNKNNRQKEYKELEGDNFILNRHNIFYFQNKEFKKVNLKKIIEKNKNDFEESTESNFLY